MVIFAFFVEDSINKKWFESIEILYIGGYEYGEQIMRIKDATLGLTVNIKANYVNRYM